MFILQFILGIRDSLLFSSSIQRYIYPKQTLGLVELLKKLFKQEICKESPESEVIAEKTFESMKLALQFIGWMILYYFVQWCLSFVIGDIASSFLYWICVIATYSKYAAGMWIRTQEVTQEAIKMETNFYLNRSFVSYQIDESEVLLMLDYSMTRIIFSVLFQLQSNILCFVIGNYLPFPINLLKIPIYSLFISIQNLSAKIPYKKHLAYFYSQNVGYLIGFNFLFSCYLHISSFPFFTGILWFIMPLYLLNAIPIEPPRFESNLQNLKIQDYLNICSAQSDLQLKRDSYVTHLNKYFNDQNYASICENQTSYISMPTLLVPWVLQILQKIISKLQGHQHED
ncbi:unnamed protein product (macronuclear) [Paramecium tetraurelia]|uniref:Uncharacterized protein n=1 Tax=Paramecium tetraurelia TaxID=5888 RepID=A0DC46_PARTE|nr:uncharacterized protein GSPATT00015490001 [Paramecium tetraurelia]CAK80613.1 unnamed protein product [Paramecium tetraurelia]|eukprot:XP_001448010.1 hypothetical protein (macronuclear) [Paramecium tetraurelia strain d4-2]